MLPINAIRDPLRHTRDERARVALELLGRIKDADLPDPKMRWSAWTDLHDGMVRSLNPCTMKDFQANEQIAPQICGGGGETYLHRLRDRLGQTALSFFLSTYRETLCGNPQDLDCVEGCYITGSAMRHVYHLAVLHEFTRRYYGREIDFVEVGGGFGNLARLAVQYSLARRYYIVDYPATLAIQYYYLTEFFDQGSVAVWNGQTYLAGSADSVIQLVTPDATVALGSILSKPSLLVSTMAMTEIPPGGQQFYLNNLPTTAVYICGQTHNASLSQGQSVAGHGALSNVELFQDLAARCHTVEFIQGEYYT
ncbi:MAG: putative sugar O-methyltransferase, partial [Chloroflexi bacterium]|nr:putative sugar O-methyltransferase [Chloroflexota bacterium]